MPITIASTDSNQGVYSRNNPVGNWDIEMMNIYICEQSAKLLFTLMEFQEGRWCGLDIGLFVLVLNIHPSLCPAKGNMEEYGYVVFGKFSALFVL